MKRCTAPLPGPSLDGTKKSAYPESRSGSLQTFDAKPSSCASNWQLWNVQRFSNNNNNMAVHLKIIQLLEILNRMVSRCQQMKLHSVTKILKKRHSFLFLSISNSLKIAKLSLQHPWQILSSPLYDVSDHDEMPERPNKWYIFEKRIVHCSMFKDIKTDITNCLIHKYTNTNTQIQHMTKCQKDPTSGIFLTRGLFNDIKSYILMCRTHKYKNTKTKN